MYDDLWTEEIIQSGWAPTVIEDDWAEYRSNLAQFAKFGYNSMPYHEDFMDEILEGMLDV